MKKKIIISRLYPERVGMNVIGKEKKRKEKQIKETKIY